MRQNKVLFGTPEARIWLLNKLRPPNAPRDDKLALRMIFGDFYSEIARQRHDTAAANAAEALTKLEVREAKLRSRDSAKNAVADELRALMGSFTRSSLICPRLTLHEAAVGINIDQYQHKFPWGTFWFILFRHNMCLRNWPKLDEKHRNVLDFSSKNKEEWCFLLSHWKVEGDESTNPILITSMRESTTYFSSKIFTYVWPDDPDETNLSQIVLATDVKGVAVITGNLIPSISNGGPAKRRSKATVAIAPMNSNLADTTAVNTPQTAPPTSPHPSLQASLPPSGLIASQASLSLNDPITSQVPGSQLTPGDLPSGNVFNFDQFSFGDSALSPLPKDLDLNWQLSAADIDLLMATGPNPTA
jgi:hypothetical protein